MTRGRRDKIGVKLKDIKSIIDKPDFDEVKALREHREKLLDKREQLNKLIANVIKTIASKKRRIIMLDKEKFEGFKKKLIEDNEEKYGKETRAKYGDEVVDKSNNKLKNITQGEYDEINKLEEDIIETLSDAFETGDPAGELAQKVADLHRKWLSFYWDGHSKEAHANIAQMYVDDERFTAYYKKSLA